MKIVRAVRSDVPRILEISNQAIETAANLATQPEPLEEWIAAWDRTSRTHPWLVAMRDDELLGFAKASPHLSRGAYTWSANVSVFVRPDVHGQRIGTTLYTHLIPLLKEQGFATLFAGITSPNPPSERLHASFGFTQCGLFHRAGWKFGRWHDVSYWELRLTMDDDQPRALRTVDEVLAGEAGSR